MTCATGSAPSVFTSTSVPTPAKTTSRRWSHNRRSGPPSSTSSPIRPPSSSRSTNGGYSSGASVVRSATAIIIGAGQSGLAMSRHLTARSIDHVVLERGEVANSWRTERWDSLRLLTPNWQSRLPGYAYDGDDPDGFMAMPEVVQFLQHYAEVARAPVVTGTRVTRVRQVEGGYEVATSQGVWRCRVLVIATGAYNIATVPALGADLPDGMTSLTPAQYRNPGLLPDGGVMIVGASASGVQLAREIHASGRRVVLSVGEHVRVPRTYRGRDILWWMDSIGAMDLG